MELHTAIKKPTLIHCGLVFFVTNKIAIIKNTGPFYNYQRDIYNVCRIIRGAGNVSSVLKVMNALGILGMKDVLNAMSSCTNIHLPPRILKPSRLYDVAAPICPCDVLNATNTIGLPSCSWRYYLCTDFEKNAKALNFLTSLWEMEEIANKDEADDFRESERTFHQMILGRSSPFACTNFIKNNALSVQITK